MLQTLLDAYRAKVLRFNWDEQIRILAEDRKIWVILIAGVVLCGIIIYAMFKMNTPILFIVIIIIVFVIWYILLDKSVTDNYRVTMKRNRQRTEKTLALIKELYPELISESAINLLIDESNNKLNNKILTSSGGKTLNIIEKIAIPFITLFIGLYFNEIPEKTTALVEKYIVNISVVFVIVFLVPLPSYIIAFHNIKKQRNALQSLRQDLIDIKLLYYCSEDKQPIYLRRRNRNKK